MSQKYLSRNGVKKLELRMGSYSGISYTYILASQKKPQLNKWLWCLKRLFCGIYCFRISICNTVSQFNDGACKQKEPRINSRNQNIKELE